jgi:hypothetical protein
MEFWPAGVRETPMMIAELAAKARRELALEAMQPAEPGLFAEKPW